MNEQRDHKRDHKGGRRGRPHAHDGRRGRPGSGDERRRGFGRMRRGDVRSALLIALLDGPGHGYELIQALESKTEGRWKPSPGSVYPALQLLTDEGLVTFTEADGKRTFELTDAGRAEADEHIETRGYPWEAMNRGGAGQGGFRTALRDFHLAAKQVAMTASEETLTQATEIITKARKDLYRLLADS